MSQEKQAPGYKQLRVWQKADDLACAIVKLARTLPNDARWLVPQVARAAISVPANIAEGYSRGSLREYIHHLSIARGSLAETEYYVHLISRTGLLDEAAVQPLKPLLQQTAGLLYALIRSLAKKLEENGSRRPYVIKEDGGAYIADVEFDPDP